jgi:microcompartment protein CcmL/EutN
MYVAIAAVETSSIAQGTVAADAMVKTADVEILELGPLSPGKFWVLIGGDVASVRASFRRGIETAGETLLDSLFIPQIHPLVIQALRGTCPPRDDDALGVIETLTAASAIVAADRAAKTSDVLLRDLRLSNGLGGKGVLWLSGEVGDVEAAVAAGRAEAFQKGLLARSVVIPRMHPQLRTRLF